LLISELNNAQVPYVGTARSARPVQTVEKRTIVMTCE